MYYPAAFDPSSCALFAHMVEQTVSTCLCSIRRPRTVPRARQWLHRNSERALDALTEDMADSALDMVNSVEPHLAVILLLFIWLRVFVVAHTKELDD